VAYEIEVTERGAVVRYTGASTVEELAAAAEAMAAHPAFHASLPTIWDLSEATDPQLSSDDMRRLAPLVSRVREGGNRPRVGIVSPSNAGFAAARMFSGLNEPRMKVNIGVFRTFEEASAWAFAEEDADGDGTSP
jgi:hypothetical protein